MHVAGRLLLMAVCAVASAGCASAQVGGNQADGSSQTAGQMVEVGGRRLRLNCMGERVSGSPTVVLESGFGSDASVWSKVQPEVLKFTRVCSYDRAGLGASQPAPASPRTVVAVTEELHALLAAAKVPAPYVLVGHSLGGMLARVYASYYPAEVVGMVLVDSAHEDEADRGVALMPQEMLKELLRTARPEDLKVQGGEAIDTCALRPLMNALNWRADIPLVVLTQGIPYRAEDYTTPALAPKYYQLHLELQKELVGRSRKGRQVIAEKSGHFIHQDQPELVIAAIRQVIAEAQTKTVRPN
ncbi:MAG TPA: alpha/beta hydrolase [Pyrinomonadaceae bacterium]|nr:alpha/beta hydrolase [Pyrinomonadaceae bacterium]